MKQSNIVLGIGIIVAVILIAGLFFLKTNPLGDQEVTTPNKPLTTINKSANSLVIIPFRTLSNYLIKTK